MSQKNLSITPAEWRWANIWAAAILLVSLVPYLVASFFAPEGWQFMGILVNPFDAHSYLSKMRQGFEGSWLFQFTYTAEPHEGTLLFLFYLALGHLARLMGLPLIIVFHLARLAMGYLLLIALFRFVCHVTPDQKERRLAYILLLTASGLGWLGLIFGLFPIDLWVPEAFVPYALFANPHFPASIALVLLLIQVIIWPPFERGLLNGGSAAILALLLAVISPFGLVVSWMAVGLWQGWWYFTQRRLPSVQLWLTLVSVLAGAPMLGYYYWITQTHPIAMGWNEQNITPAPTLPNLLFGYGLLGLLAILGGWYVSRRREAGEWLVLLWAVGALVLIYLPLDLQRRLLTGLHVPLGLLAAIGLTRWLKDAALKTRRRLTMLVIVFGALGTLLVWTLPLLGLIFQPPTSDAATSALFLLRDEEEVALDWLRENTEPEAVILAPTRLSTFIPGETGRRVVYGHPFETINAAEKRAQVEAFYRGEGDAPAMGNTIDYIIVGPAATRSLDLPVLFSTEDITIYEAR